MFLSNMFLRATRASFLALVVVTTIDAPFATAWSQEPGKAAKPVKLQMAVIDKTISCGMDVFYFNKFGDVFFDQEIHSLTPKNVVVNTSTKLTLSFPPSGARTEKYDVEILLTGKKNQDCLVERGVGSFLAYRHEMVRESVCGNDPADACIAALQRLCGVGPTQACATSHEKALEAISQRSVR